MHSFLKLTGAAVGALLVAVVAASPAAAQATRTLDGTFRILPGTCTASGTPQGSYFRLVEPTGSIARGPYFDNPDSTCARQTVTLLRPGTGGGLVSGRFQGPVAGAFDRAGNARLNRIIQPARFGGVSFSLGTFARTPGTTTGRRVSAPRIQARGRRLSGQLSSLTAAWNSQWFNQGTPKPGGSRPGLTSTLTGTYDPRTRRYTLSWASHVSSGPFRNFTGVWRLQGRFVPRGG
ncbi:MAG: hypothetical protein Q8O56_05210 [Solirubrobacteraceae bacterium]|nr:hypothetical protein [Solirubrobacteraceae bacterium]